MNWEEFDAETRQLARTIDYLPDAIIGIARGGVIPAVLLSTELKVKEMHFINMRRVGDERPISPEFTADISGKSILLVEDMIETGKSFDVGKAYLEKKGAKVKTACLYIMPISRSKPDYFLSEVPEVVQFPWEQRPTV